MIILIYITERILICSICTQTVRPLTEVLSLMETKKMIYITENILICTQILRSRTYWVLPPIEHKKTFDLRLSIQISRPLIRFWKAGETLEPHTITWADCGAMEPNECHLGKTRHHRSSGNPMGAVIL